MSLLHEKLSYALRGCFYDVHNILGMGYDEESYHLALEQRLIKANIHFQSKVTSYIEHRGTKIHQFIADLIIEDKVILELKSIVTNFHPAHHLQLLSYLKNWQKDLGMLVNFGQSSVNVYRMPFTEKKTTFIEDYSELEGLIYLDNRKCLKLLRAAILTIFELYGLGYYDTVYKRLVCAELTHRDTLFAPQALIPVKYDGKIIRHFELNYPLIDNRILCGIIAIKEDLTPQIYKMRTYLKAANLYIGILAHFGKEKLEIIGIRP